MASQLACPWPALPKPTGCCGTAIPCAVAAAIGTAVGLVVRRAALTRLTGFIAAAVTVATTIAVAATAFALAVAATGGGGGGGGGSNSAGIASFTLCIYIRYLFRIACVLEAEPSPPTTFVADFVGAILAGRCVDTTAKSAAAIA